MTLNLIDRNCKNFNLAQKVSFDGYFAVQNGGTPNCQIYCTSAATTLSTYRSVFHLGPRSLIFFIYVHPSQQYVIVYWLPMLSSFAIFVYIQRNYFMLMNLPVRVLFYSISQRSLYPVDFYVILEMSVEISWLQCVVFSV